MHGLDADPANVAGARESIRSQGLYGPVSVDHLAGSRLPYADNTVRLLVADDLGPVPMAGVRRVLCPGGAARVKRGDRAATTQKPWPKEIDEWTHGLHGPDNNAVSQDTVVAPPHHLQWVGGPTWCRSHDHLSSVSAVVSSGGRVFAIVDEGPAAAVALPANWRLVARDAFSGVVLWKRKVEPWEGHLRGFRTGPAAILRRLVAVGDTVYATLGYGKPVTALDAATGEFKHTGKGTDDALEILCAKDVLYLVLGPTVSHGAALSEHENVGRAPRVPEGGKRLWESEAREAYNSPPDVLVADGLVWTGILVSAREIREPARQSNLATQGGSQGGASDSLRRSMEAPLHLRRAGRRRKACRAYGRFLPFPW